MNFTIEEEKVLEEVHHRFQFHQQSWLKNLFLINREAGLNILESVYKIAPLKIHNWAILEKAFHLYFVTNVVPKFLENTILPTKDIGQIVNGQNSGMAHLFKISQFTTLDKKQYNINHEDCQVKKQVFHFSNETIPHLFLVVSYSYFIQSLCTF